MKTASQSSGSLPASSMRTPDPSRSTRSTGAATRAMPRPSRARRSSSSSSRSPTTVTRSVSDARSSAWWRGPRVRGDHGDAPVAHLPAMAVGTVERGLAPELLEPRNVGTPVVEPVRQEQLAGGDGLAADLELEAAVDGPGAGHLLAAEFHGGVLGDLLAPDRAELGEAASRRASAGRRRRARRRWRAPPCRRRRRGGACVRGPAPPTSRPGRRRRSRRRSCRFRRRQPSPENVASQPLGANRLASMPSGSRTSA